MVLLSSSSSLVISIILLCSTTIIFADILVYTNDKKLLVEEFRDLPARFGQQIPSSGINIQIIQAEPIQACGPLKPPPKRLDPSSSFGVIIQRGGINCTFEQKVRNAQTVGYDAAIVYNVNSNDLETMSAQNGDDIFIYSVFVGETTGKLLIQNYQYLTGYFIVLNDDLPFNINTHLILPFSIVVGLVFVIITGFMVIKCVREQRRLRRRRLPRSVLKTIPIIKFNKSHPYETCAICLDDYVDGEKLRVLPCAHAYHSKCIDPWLTKTRRVCPVCKRKVLPRRRQRPVDRNSSDYSSSDTDADDTTPLINPVENSNNHGTFNPSVSEGNETPSNRMPRPRENPFNRSVNDTLEATNSNGLSPFWNRFTGRSNLSDQQDASVPVSPENSTLIRSSHVVLAPPATSANNPPSHHTQTVIDVPTTHSNNLLNANLSGSFRDGSNDESHRQPPARVGVAALPNTEFSSQGHNYIPRDDSYA